MTKHDDSQPITSVINTGELMRQLAQKEADHRRRVQSWTADGVEELTDTAELLDIALHHSKRTGGTDGGRVSLFDDALEASTRRRAEMDVELQDAIERGELSVAYQQIVNLTTVQRDRAALRNGGSQSRVVDYLRDEVAERMMERFLVCCLDSVTKNIC